MAELYYKEESYQIMGACFEVYKQLGCGFKEAVYQESLSMELWAQSIPFQPQLQLGLEYKGKPLRSYFIADFTCWDKIIVEIKAVPEIIDLHRVQVQNYLKATGYKLGILVNFGSHPKAEWERIVR